MLTANVARVKSACVGVDRRSLPQRRSLSVKAAIYRSPGGNSDDVRPEKNKHLENSFNAPPAPRSERESLADRRKSAGQTKTAMTFSSSFPTFTQEDAQEPELPANVKEGWSNFVNFMVYGNSGGKSAHHWRVRNRKPAFYKWKKASQAAENDGITNLFHKAQIYAAEENDIELKGWNDKENINRRRWGSNEFESDL